ncbi:hypothetical protein GCM10009801_16780 [Streptomyces albiaxialis]|uniref:Uncharacterized protein n=1 Tax=Streptomyces albiaxialis TaxID=329523 RepID=A0ABP5HC59_9ACTN
MCANCWLSAIRAAEYGPGPGAGGIPRVAMSPAASGGRTRRTRPPRQEFATLWRRLPRLELVRTRTFGSRVVHLRHRVKR